MTTLKAQPGRESAELANVLFETPRHRRSFVRERIVSARPTWCDEVDAAEQVPALGPVLLDADFAYDAEAGVYRRHRDLIRAAGLFIEESELESKRAAALRWARSIAARDIQPLVITYTLNSEGTDFRSLKRLEPHWLPDEISTGDHFHYEGKGYPLPGRGIPLPISGAYEIIEIVDDEDGIHWFEVRDLETDEHVFLAWPLLLTARFENS